MYETLKLSKEGPVATLELQRGDAGNGFDETLHREFSEALVELKTAADIRVVLLSAAGPMFSAGGDLEYIERLSADAELRERTHCEGLAAFSALLEMPVPIVAAVHGHAVGFGATIVSACDVSVAWRKAKLGDPHVLVGLVAGDGGVLSWSAAVGYNRARRLLLTGDTITADLAHDFGLITDLVDRPEDALPQARAIAERIASLSPVAVRGTKRAFIALAKAQNGDALEVSLREEVASLTSAELQAVLSVLKNNKRT